MNESAKVYLVGTGPGDPDLLTVKALRLLQNADVVIYDRLVSEGILQQIPAGVSKIYVGKQSGNHTLPQNEINQLLLNLADTERTIVRLKVVTRLYLEGVVKKHCYYRNMKSSLKLFPV